MITSSPLSFGAPWLLATLYLMSSSYMVSPLKQARIRCLADIAIARYISCGTLQGAESLWFTAAVFVVAARPDFFGMDANGVCYALFVGRVASRKGRGKRGGTGQAVGICKPRKSYAAHVQFHFYFCGMPVLLTGFFGAVDCHLFHLYAAVRWMALDTQLHILSTALTGCRRCKRIFRGGYENLLFRSIAYMRRQPMTSVVGEVVDNRQSVDNQKARISERIRQVRSVLKMTQKDLVSSAGIPLPSLRDYEGGKRVPGGDAIASFVKAGVNANWLLTGDGPMLLADLAPQKPRPAQINVEALAQTLAAVLATAPPGETREQSAHKAVQFYMQMVERGLITPDGVGDGGLETAA